MNYELGIMKSEMQNLKLNKKLRDKQGQALRRNSGQAVLMVVTFLTFISLAVLYGIISPTIKNVSLSRGAINSSKSYYLAESGTEDAYYRLKSGKQISSTETLSLNGIITTTNISNLALGKKEIRSSGDASSNIRSVEVIIQTGTGVDFPYGAQVGAGGLEMGQNSRVEGAGGTAGNVYSNGPVKGENGATVTGSLTVASSLTEDTGAQLTVCNQDQIVGQNNPQIDFAQSFRPTSSGSLYKVSLYIKKTSGSNPPSSTIRIVADNNGSPATTDIANESFSASLVTTSYGWVDITFASPADIVGGQTYWLLLDAGQNSSRYWTWCKDGNAGYGNGAPKYKQDWNSGGSWTATIGDLTFKTYFGSGPGIIDDVDVSGNAYANTITGSTITGTAYCQTGSGNNKSCNTSQADPVSLNMPISQGNIDQWKLDADPDNLPRNGSLNVTTNMSYGPEKVIGDLNLTSNNKTLTVTGTIYVTGNVDISNGSAIRCATSYGQDSCLVIADGWIHIDNNGTFSGSGQTGSYIMLLSTLSGCNGADGSTGCTHHDAALDLHNQATGAIFYIQNSMANLHNGVQVTSITAYKLKLDNTAVVRYEEGVANTNFSGGPGGGWNIDSWEETE